MPELIRNGNIYLALPPLYKITQGKDAHYLLDDSALRKFQEDNQGRKFEVGHFKGLGEMDPEELQVTTLDPRTRRMQQVTITDEKIVAKTFEDLMGSSVPNRRKFIEDNAEMANISI